MATRASQREPATGVPAEITALIGRRREVAGVRRLLSESRLVTLTGVGGAGKTRLAIEVAATVGPLFPDGLHVVELAALRDGDLLAQHVAAALGLRRGPARDAYEVLVGHLRSRQLLLVLDNCEHLVDSCAHIVDRLLRAAAGLSVLATSRQVLRVTGEHVFPVPPLSTPAPGTHYSVRELLRFPSITLFEQRAAAVLPGFAVRPDSAESIAELVQVLDGLPLAIELAAAHMRTLTVPEILSRLGDRYTLLTLGSRAAQPRHRTLRELIDWSHALCTEAEQALWARASVFSGSFDLSAAEAVCTDDSLSQAAVANAANGLVEKSLLIRQEHGGQSRYHMLETIRTYGAEHLVRSGELEFFRRRHRDHYLDVTAQADREWFGPGQTQWFSRLRLDHGNLRVALAFCLETPGETAKGFALAVSPRHYWITLGSLDEGTHWLSRLLDEDSRTGAPSPGRAAALSTYGYLAVLRGSLEQALPLLSAARAAAEQEGDLSTLAWVTHHFGVVATWRQDFVGAGARFTEAAAGLRALGDVGGAAECTMKQALVAAFAGDRLQAAELCAALDTLTTAHGESWIRAMTHFVRSLMAWQDGDHRTTQAEGLAAVGLLRPFNDWWDIAMSVELLAASAARAGDPRRAATLFGILESLWQSIGGTLSVVPFLVDARQQAESAVRTALGVKAFDHERRAGACLTVSSAMAFVLRDKASDASGRWSIAGSTAGSMAGTGTASELTRREREVAGLVSDGLTNKEIATNLGIAPRTAENHVERIFAKVGLRSRAQLAVWWHEQRDGSDRL